MALSYTVYKNHLIDDLIESHITEVHDAIITQIKDTVGIVFMGGFSRGEGSVLLEKQKIKPLGDYDFLVITRFPHLRSNSIHFGDLAKSFGIGHLDIGTFWVSLLSTAPKKIFWYELKFGSRLLSGNIDILNRIPINASHEIALSDGLSLLFNRLDGLLRNFNPQFFSTPPPKELAQLLVFEAAKGVLACGDSLLVLKRKYHYSYQRRLEILKEIYNRDFTELSIIDTDFLADFEFATNFKLKPNFESIPNPIHFWQKARYHLLKIITYYWKKWNNTSDIEFADLPKRLIERSRFNFRDYATYNLGKNKKIFYFNASFSDTVRASLYYLASAVNDDSIDLGLTIKSLKLIKTITNAYYNSGLRLPEETWMHTRDVIDNAWSSTSK